MRAACYKPDGMELSVRTVAGAAAPHHHWIMAKIRIGISGWRYAPWRASFYPQGLPQKDELAFAAGKFSTIEINGTFYGTQRPESFENWRDTVPAEFMFAVKGPRFITHIRRLRDVEGPLANFFASGVLRLREKLGPFLWQFPPSMKFDPALFETFLGMLPHDMKAATQLAKGHDDKLKRPDVAVPPIPYRLRHAVEIRHESFRRPDFIKLLQRANVALVCADTVEWPRLMDVTSDFVYCRLHGSEQLYANGYDDEALGAWRARVLAWARGHVPEDATLVPDAPRGRAKKRDVFMYFDNDYEGPGPCGCDTARGDAQVFVKPTTQHGARQKSWTATCQCSAYEISAKSPARF